MFTEVPGNVVILRSGGVFYQREVYRQHGTKRVFAKHGGGYIRLGAGGATSKPKCEWLDLVGAPDVLPSGPTRDPEFA